MGNRPQTPSSFSSSCRSVHQNVCCVSEVYFQVMGRKDFRSSSGEPHRPLRQGDGGWPITPAKQAEPSPDSFDSWQPSPIQAGSAFASCLSGPSRRSHMLRPADLQTALRRLLSPKLRTLCHLHIRWDSYPAGTTFTGAGLSPAGITNLFTAHVDQRTSA